MIWIALAIIVTGVITVTAYCEVHDIKTTIYNSWFCLICVIILLIKVYKEL